MFPSPASACAEKIAILHLLHEVPTLPSTNAGPGPSSSFSKQYSLPFERERDLCSTLAFLSCTKDDPSRIPALSLQECPEKPALNVLLAVNSSQYGDGLQTLRNIEAGFEKIFLLLNQSPHGGLFSSPHIVICLLTVDIEEDVFGAIVSMCSVRIRERTRLVDRQATKQSLKQLLQVAMRSLSPSSPFLDMSRKALAKANLWLQHQTLARLQDMVESVRHLSRLDHLRDVLESIPNRQMDPHSKKSLLNMIKKLARYRDAARYLCRTAKKFAIVRRMKVQIVTLPRDSFQAWPSLSNAELSSTSAGLQLTKKTKKQFNQCLRLFGVSETAAVRQVMKCKSDIISKGKVHAEIQLIHHLEEQVSSASPRVICSSKDACFLCNAFITTHGKLYTPRSHGRLYPKWRLPLFAPNSGLEERFVTTLDNIIQESLRITLQRQKKTSNAPPLESTAPTVSLSNSTLIALETGAAGDPVGAALQTTDDIVVSPLSSGFATSEVQISADHLDEDKWQAAIQRDDTVSMPTKSAAQPTKTVLLPPGTEFAVTVKADSSSALYEAWPLILQIEYSAQTPDHDRTLLCHLERLREYDAEAVRNAQSATILDVDLLQESLTVSLKDFQNFYISAGGILLRVRVA